MTPEFPVFKKIALTDKGDIEVFTKKFFPYSDFNFVSMWSWDVKGEMEVSQLNNNLVVKFTDYLTGFPFYSFIGITDVNDTTSKLISYAREQGLEARLKLVPEDAVRFLDRNVFEVIEDRDHFDYILSLEMLSAYGEHSVLRGHASHQRHYLEQYGDKTETRVIDLGKEAETTEIHDLTKKWMQNKVTQNKDLLPHLEDAVYRYFLQEQFYKDCIAVGIYYDNQLIAYNINELIDQDFCVCHFMKADNTYKGVYSHLVSESSRLLLQRGKKYTNFEQDLGLPNLRQSKKTFHPVNFLRKYSIVVR